MTRRPKTLALIGVLVSTAVAARADAALPNWVGASTEIPSDARYAISDIVILLDSYELKLGSAGHKGVRHWIGVARTERGAKRLRFTTYSDPLHEITSFHAWSHVPRGQTRSFGENEVGEFRNAAEEYVFREYRKLDFRPPHVTPGMLLVVEYEFRLDPQLPQNLLSVSDLNPVVAWRLHLKCDSEWQARISFGQLEGKPAENVTTAAEWEFHDLAGQQGRRSTDEPLPPHPQVLLSFSRKDGEQPISDWAGVARWEREIFDRVDQRKTRFAALASQVQSSPDPVLSTRGAARNIRYFGNEIGWSGLVPRSPERTVEIGMGDCKDKALLMSALLENAGIDAIPVLIGSPIYNYVDPTLPTSFQFNHAIVGIVWTGRPVTAGMTIVDAPGLGRLRLIDGVLPPGSSLDTDWWLQGAVGLPVDRRATGVFHVADADRSENVRETKCRWKLTSTGELTAECERSYAGIFSSELEHETGEIRTEAEIRAAIYAEIGAFCSDGILLDVDGAPVRDKTVYHLRFRYRCSQRIADFGALQVVDLPSFAAIEEFEPPGSAGYADTTIRALHEIRDRYELSLPAESHVSLPVLSLRHPIGSVELEWKADGNNLTLARRLTVDQRSVDLANRDAILALRAALVRMNHVAVVLPTPAQ